MQGLTGSEVGNKWEKNLKLAPENTPNFFDRYRSFDTRSQAVKGPGYFGITLNGGACVKFGTAIGPFQIVEKF